MFVMNAKLHLLRPCSDLAPWSTSSSSFLFCLGDGAVVFLSLFKVFFGWHVCFGGVGAIVVWAFPLDYQRKLNFSSSTGSSVL